MKFTTLFSTLLAASSVNFAASAFTPASAFNISETGGMAGNPSQPLWSVGIDRNDIGSTFQTNWFLESDNVGGLSQDLSAFSSFKVLDFSSNTLDLEIDITNTTRLTSTFTEATINSFGFGIDPNATGVSFLDDGDVFNQAKVQNGQQQFPGGFKKIDICVFAANNCSGGDVKKGLLAGSSDTLKLRINGDFSKGEATLANFPVKFQTTDGSYELAGAGSVEPVPEPLTILGTGMAFGFGGLFKKELSKKQRQKLKKETDS